MKKNQTLLFLLILTATALNSIVSYMNNPVFPEYLLTKGVEFSKTGLISSLMSWIALFFTPVSGLISDRWNKKKVLVFSYSVTTVCMFLYTFASSIASVVAVRIIHGVAFAFAATMNLTFATLFINKERIAEGLSYVALAMLVGNMFGPTIGSYVKDYVSLEATFTAAGVISLISLLIIIYLPYTHVKSETKFEKITFSNLYASELTVFMILIFIFSFGNSIQLYYLKSYGEYKAISGIALFFTVNTLVMAVSKPLASKIHDRKGVSYILYPAYILTALSMFVISSAKTMTGVIVSAVLKAIGQGTGSPAIQAESIKQIGVDRSGVAVSTCMIGQGFGNSIGPIIGSNLIAVTSYETAFNLTGYLTIFGLIMFFIYDRLVLKRNGGKVK